MNTLNKAASLVIALLALTACGARESALPQVLIIGDSISIGYTPFVAKRLKDEGLAEVVHNPGNAKFSANTRAKLELFLAASPDASVIVWNNGLHDLRAMSPGVMRASIAEYKKNLRFVGRRLLRTDARVVFMTTTHVPANEPTRDPDLVAAYNLAARQIMSELHIPVADLNKLSNKLADEGLHQRAAQEDDVHWSTEGSRRLAEFVSKIVRKELLK